MLMSTIQLPNRPKITLIYLGKMDKEQSENLKHKLDSQSDFEISTCPDTGHVIAETTLDDSKEDILSKFVFLMDSNQKEMIKMKSFIDGDQLCITRDDFINLQESPAVFYPLSSEVAQTIIKDGFLALPVADLRNIYSHLRLEYALLLR